MFPRLIPSNFTARMNGNALQLLLVFCGLLRDGYSAISEMEKADQLREYCLEEDFEAQCLKNEVVAINEARFGRMNIGRCLSSEGKSLLTQLASDPKYIGCSVDVVSLLDSICATKSHCIIRPFNDIDQKIEKPCHAALRSYLAVSYECLAVVQPDRACTVSVTSSAQHLMISQSSSTELSCGSRYQPWKLEAPAGQQINVSLMGFGGAMNQRDGKCLQYGYIIDSGINKNISGCGLMNERKKNIYTSVSNILKVVLEFNSENIDNVGSSILAGVEAIGCTDVIPPEDMWLRRRNQEAVVGCYSSRQTWYLNCVNNQWLGVIGNCTRENAHSVMIEEKNKDQSIGNTTAVVATGIILVGLIICVGIIMIGVLCIKRYDSKLKNLQYSKKMDGNNVDRNWLTAPRIQHTLLQPQA